MANVVEIFVRANAQQAERGFRDMNRTMRDSRQGARAAASGVSGFRGSVTSLRRELLGGMSVFRDFRVMLGALGLGSIAAGVGMRQVITTTNQMRQTAAATSVILRALGPEFVESLDGARPELQLIAQEFGFTAAEMEEAFGIIARESRQAGHDIDVYRFAAALARTQGISLAQAADIVGKAMMGNIEPLRQMTGELGSLEQIMKIVTEEGEQATTVWQRMGGELRNTQDGIGGLITALFELRSRNDETFGEGLVKALKFKTAIEGLKDAASLVRRDFELLPEPIRDALTFRTAIEGAKQSFGDLRDFIQGAFRVIRDDTQGTTNAIIGFFQSAWSVIRADTAGTFNQIKGAIQGVLPGNTIGPGDTKLQPHNVTPGQAKSAVGNIHGSGGSSILGGISDAILAPLLGGLGGLGSAIAPSYKVTLAPGSMAPQVSMATSPGLPGFDATEKGSRPSELGDAGRIRAEIRGLESEVQFNRRRLEQTKIGRKDTPRDREIIASVEAHLQDREMALALKREELQRVTAGPQQIAIGDTGAAIPHGMDPTINITINGNVDSEGTVRDLVRQVQDLIQENLRRGGAF